MKLTKEQLVDAITQTKQYHNQHSGGGGGGVTALTSLSDVSCDYPEDGQTLIFSAADNMWHNAAVPSSGGGGGGGATANTYRSIKMDISALYGVGGAIQLSEIKLYKNGNLIAWPNGTTCTSSIAGFNGEGPSNLIDGRIDTKYCAKFTDNCVITIDTPVPITFDSYSYVTAPDASKYPERNPKSWTLYCSADNVTYSIMGTIYDAQAPSADSSETQLFAIEGVGSHNNVYSTQEQIVGTWIDGKPIYRKVLDYSNELWASGTKDITELFIEQIISSYFIGCDGATGGGIQWAQGVISSNTKCLYFSEDYTQMFRTGNAYYKYVILEYTKIKTYPEESFVDRYTVVTTSTSGTTAAVRVTNILDGTSTDIVYTSVINGKYVDFGEFTIRYTDQSTGWLLTCTSEALKVGTSVLINGKSKAWLYNTSIDFVVRVYTE